MALYHKYRPQTFKDVVDQSHIIKTIVNQVINGKTAHAYLFSGPRGIGKTTTARILAKTLNCENKKDGESEPCNECNSCQEISRSQSIDVIEIDAASHTGVDNVRQNIIENSQFKPTKSKYKIFIIDEVHMLSTAAFNALLKTLEEPPLYVSFILATTDPHKLPITIVSRCQRFNFKKVPNKEMEKYLNKISKAEKIKIDSEVLKKIIKKSEGCVRDAITLLDQISTTGEKHLTIENTQFILPMTKIEDQLDFSKRLLDEDTKGGIDFVNKLNEEGFNLNQFGLELIEFLRYLLIYKIDPKLSEEELDLSSGDKNEFDELSKKITNLELVKLIDLTIRRTREIKSSPLQQLPLEMLVIEWCSRMKNETSDDEKEERKDEQNNKTKDIKIEKKENTELENVNKTIRKLDNNIQESKWQKVKKIIKKEDKEDVDVKDISKEDVDKIWNEFIGKIESDKPSLVFILKMANFLGTEKNIIKLQIQYRFHQEKLMDKTTKPCLEGILSELIGSRVRIDVSISEEEIVKEENNELTELATALGGEVIG